MHINISIGLNIIDENKHSEMHDTASVRSTDMQLHRIPCHASCNYNNKDNYNYNNNIWI